MSSEKHLVIYEAQITRIFQAGSSIDGIGSMRMARSGLLILGQRSTLRRALSISDYGLGVAGGGAGLSLWTVAVYRYFRRIGQRRLGFNFAFDPVARPTDPSVVRFPAAAPGWW